MCTEFTKKIVIDSVDPQIVIRATDDSPPLISAIDLISGLTGRTASNACTHLAYCIKTKKIRESIFCRRKMAHNRNHPTWLMHPKHAEDIMSFLPKSASKKLKRKALEAILKFTADENVEAIMEHENDSVRLPVQHHDEDVIVHTEEVAENNDPVEINGNALNKAHIFKVHMMIL